MRNDVEVDARDVLRAVRDRLPREAGASDAWRVARHVRDAFGLGVVLDATAALARAVLFEIEGASDLALVACAYAVLVAGRPLAGEADVVAALGPVPA